MTNICIFGAGYVGKEVAKLASHRGFSIMLVDSDPTVVAEIQEGYQLENAKIDRVTTNGSLVVEKADVIVCAVPTPLSPSHAVDLGAVKSVTETISRVDPSSEKLYVIESTVPPGTTEDVIVPILESNGLVVGQDIYVAHVPERINPGDGDWPLEAIPRVAGAASQEGLTRTVTFYESLLDANVHPVTSPSVAEASKIVENAYRDINIAFVNEIAMTLDYMEIDTELVLEAAATKPFGFARFSPGVGVGGHCIPVDPYFLIGEADARGFDNRLLKYSRDINDGMPKYVSEITLEALSAIGIRPEGARVVLLGKAFKPNVSDVRNSPYFRLKDELQAYEVVVETYDPHVPADSTIESPYVPADAVVLVTAHEEFHSLSFKIFRENNVQVFIDGRNLYNPEDSDEYGINYVGVGR